MAKKSKSPKATLLAKSPDASWVEMTEIVLPQHTNALGTVFGGVVMSWVDIAAATCAIRHSRRPCVTASIDALHFRAAIKLGWIVTIRASINYVANTSCEIGVKVIAENPRTGDTSHTASAYLTFVSLDDNGRPTPIPPILPKSPDERRRQREAETRREARLSLKETLKARRSNADT